MKSPSTVVIAPRRTIQTIPASGSVPSTMESSRTTKKPPGVLRVQAERPVHKAIASSRSKDRRQQLHRYGWKLTSTVLLSLAASVTFCVFSLYFSCTKAKV